MANNNRSRRGYGQTGYNDYDEGRFAVGGRYQNERRYSGDRNETSWDFDRENRGESSQNYRGSSRSGYGSGYEGGYQGSGYRSGGYSGYRGMGDDVPRDQNQSYYTGRYSSNRDFGDYVGDDDEQSDYAYGGYGSRDRDYYYGGGSESGQNYGDDRYTRGDRNQGGRIGSRQYGASQRGGYRGTSDRY